MIHNLTPYPAYKDSGVPWLGQVPEHWEVLPALAVYKSKMVKNIGMVEKTVLSLSYGRIIVKPEEKLHGLVPESFETYQIVEPGNIIVRTTDLQNDKNSLRVGHSHNRGIITAAYMCLETTDGVSNEFGYQFLNTYDLLKIIYGYGSGLRQNLDFSHIKRMPVLVPPFSEQSAIVRYLDYMDRRIRRYIHAKQKLIKLLEEQKQAIIHRAVTRGLDPKVKLKPSGVEWLGDVPEHWDLSALRRHCEVIDCKHLTVPFVDEGIPLASVRQVQGFDLDLSTSNRTTEEWYSHLINGGRLPKHGDIIYCRNVSVGACSFVKGDDIFAMGQDVCLIRSEAENGRFMNYFLHSHAMKQELSLVLVGSTFKRINISQIKSLLIIMPPRNEQDEIVSALDSSLSKLDKPIELAQQEIAFIREYRARLISDVVTGKLDVREAVASLPEVVVNEVDEGEEETVFEDLSEGEL